MSNATRPTSETRRHLVPISTRLSAALIAAAAIVLSSPGRDAYAQAGAPDKRPNFVVVMTDDQDVRSVAVMEEVQQELVARGTTFESFFATFPLCCPSRATFLTGQYAHNHGVLSNIPPAGGYPAFTEPETAMPAALDGAGYRTGLIGKYLNNYPADGPIPPGWDVWRAATTQGLSSYNYDLRVNERTIHYGRQPEDFRTDVYADLARRFIHHGDAHPDPFFLTVAPGAPHTEPGGPPKPGPDYDGRFDATPLPAPPSFNELDISDKPHFLQRPALTEEAIAELTTLHRARLASLLSVDALVERVIRALRATGELSRTYVIFTSDNGFMLGEHRLMGKTRLYEESARVPLIIRGPGIPAGATREQMTGNIDLAPTILDAADVEPLRPPDGRSLLPLTSDSSVAWRQEILLENRESVAIRTPDHMYAEHPGGERELYDVRTDPFQLQSLHADPEQSALIDALSARLAELRDCVGSECP